ncbi:hypothetical protein ACS0TY_022187 [Phlomoides rotata]
MPPHRTVPAPAPVNNNNAWQNQFGVLDLNDDRDDRAPISPAFMVHGSEHPGMILVSHPLNGLNFVSWHKSMLIALGAKSKLGFIDGSLVPPARNTPDYILWKKADCLGQNGLEKDIELHHVASNKQKFSSLNGASNGEKCHLV